MKRIPLKAIALLLLMAATTTVSAQQSFNYKNDFAKILAQTKDPKSELFYDKLLNRFAVNDTTLTHAEVLALMIGFTARPEYKPYQDIQTETAVYDLNDKEQYKQGLKEGMKFIKTHPLSVKVIHEIAWSYYKLGQRDSSDVYLDKGQRLFLAMHYAGNGLDPETPVFALGPGDGQDYIHKVLSAGIGTMGSGSDKNGQFLDILEAKMKDGQQVKMYFIIQHAVDKMFTPEEKKKMNALEAEMKAKTNKGN